MKKYTIDPSILDPHSRDDEVQIIRSQIIDIFDDGQNADFSYIEDLLIGKHDKVNKTYINLREAYDSGYFCFSYLPDNRLRAVTKFFDYIDTFYTKSYFSKRDNAIVYKSRNTMLVLYEISYTDNSNGFKDNIKYKIINKYFGEFDFDSVSSMPAIIVKESESLEKSLKHLNELCISVSVDFSSNKILCITKSNSLVVINYSIRGDSVVYGFEYNGNKLLRYSCIEDVLNYISIIDSIHGKGEDNRDVSISISLPYIKASVYSNPITKSLILNKDNDRFMIMDIYEKFDKQRASYTFLNHNLKIVNSYDNLFGPRNTAAKRRIIEFFE